MLRYLFGGGEELRGNREDVVGEEGERDRDFE